MCPEGQEHAYLAPHGTRGCTSHQENPDSDLSQEQPLKAPSPSDFLRVCRPHNVNSVLGKLIYGKGESGTATPTLLHCRWRHRLMTSLLRRPGLGPPQLAPCFPALPGTSETNAFLLTSGKEVQSRKVTVRTLLMSSPKAEHKMHLKKFYESS